ncbi:hypothetical protein MSAN_00445500 [Mycena sanguinolenta]|uniref:Uncharacterized protein n=1 Tax=Mycena sanguinolenta TaxID=230812 RepID=A0A8H6ZDB6_9AGAR|nr:hypothetical protein MSAN_00445500 [Mycena sanguinolenta]
MLRLIGFKSRSKLEGTRKESRTRTALLLIPHPSVLCQPDNHRFLLKSRKRTLQSQQRYEEKCVLERFLLYTVLSTRCTEKYGKTPREGMSPKRAVMASAAVDPITHGRYRSRAPQASECY